MITNAIYQMNAHKANLINVVTLMVVSTWGYIQSLTPSIIDLLPLLVGVVLLSLNNGIKFGLNAQINAAAVITGFVFVGLAKAGNTALENVDHEEIIRYGLMALTSLFSLIFFIYGYFQKKIKSLKS